MSLEEDPSQNTTADGAGIVAAGNEHSHADPTNEQANVKREKRGAAGKSGDSDEGKPDQPRSKRPLIILVAVVVVFGITSFAVWFARRNQVSTDDAFTDGNVVTMVPKVSGYVVALYINDNSLVKKGDLLLRIDP